MCRPTLNDLQSHIRRAVPLDGERWLSDRWNRHEHSIRASSADGPKLYGTRTDVTKTVDGHYKRDLCGHLKRDPQWPQPPRGSSGSGACVARGPGQIKQSGFGGRFSLTINPGVVASPSGPILPPFGQTWKFQAWYRDVNSLPIF